MSSYVFAYGTLRPTGRNYGIGGTERTDIKGTLTGYQMKLVEGYWFPCLIHTGKKEDKVIGDILKAPNLKYLDKFEGAEPDDPEAMYNRQKVEVDTGDAKMNVWVYIYNHPQVTEKWKVIPNGDWLAWHNRCWLQLTPEEARLLECNEHMPGQFRVRGRLKKGNDRWLPSIELDGGANIPIDTVFPDSPSAEADDERYCARQEELDALDGVHIKGWVKPNPAEDTYTLYNVMIDINPREERED